tara:strand:- start:9 stop:785 length:777 start_codon:yes stop_codon:yes gene_type:complete
MLYPRIIPCLLIKDKGLVKTTNFKNPVYVGDPINAVKIFNEKEVDELIVIDIDASKNNVEPNYELISHLALESRMPLCYGGGIKSYKQALKILSMGVEKIALGSVAIENPIIISEIAEIVGNQSIVAVIDIKKKRFSKNYDIFTINAKNKSDLNVFDAINTFEKLGCGELLVNSIDRDGTMIGYDKEIVEKIIESINIPITILGGAGSLQDIEDLIHSFGTIGIAAGSLFVFKGKYKAVLINYPDNETKEKLVINSLS